MLYDCCMELSVFVSPSLRFTASDISSNVRESFISNALALFSLILASIPAIFTLIEAISSSIDLSFSSHSDISLSSISFFLSSFFLSFLSFNSKSFLDEVISNSRDLILLSRLSMHKSLSSYA